jgi:hypothetical protein
MSASHKPPPPDELVTTETGLVCRFCGEELERVHIQPGDRRRRSGPNFYVARGRAEAPRSRYGAKATSAECMTPGGLLTMHDPAKGKDNQ